MAMRLIKRWLKKILPTTLLRPLLSLFHWIQALAANIYYGLPARGLKVIGITGTNGKTTTAAFLGKIIERGGGTVGINSTAFYQIGRRVALNDTNMTVTDPFRFFRLLREFRRAKVDWVILEVTSHALSQHRLLGVNFSAAVMTNLTQDHLDYHGTMEAYAAAKARLFRRAKQLAVLNLDDAWFEFFRKAAAAKRVVTYGTKRAADCRIVSAKLTPNGSHLKLKLERVQIEPQIKLVGKFNAYNALAAATAAYAIGIEPEIINDGLESLQQVPGRMEIIKAKAGFKVVVDYAHTADALANVLESLRGVSKGRIITVFGATGDRDRSKRPDMGRTAARLSDVIIVTDDDTYTENPITIRAEILAGAHEIVDGADIYEVADRRGAILKALELARRGDIILLAGIGHQKYRVIGGRKVAWSERDVVEELLAKRSS